MKNRGYTLIELIVAISILAIIAIPLMHGFVTSARMNAKAREIEQATTVAQNVMEEIKVTDVEELITDVEPGKTSVLTDEGEWVDMLTYQLPMRTETADGVNYRVDITLENGPYGDELWPQYTDYNLKDMAQLYDMNAAYDAFYILEEATDTALIEELAVAAGVSTTRVRNEVERNIYLDIKEELGTRIVEVNVAYTYRGDTRYMAAQNQCIYTSSSLDTYLRNVYVFFEPLNNREAGEEVREKVTVRNNCCSADKKPVRVYLVKQGTAFDENYKVAVNLMEQSRELSTYRDAEGNLKVMTGICTNISFPKDVTDVSADQIEIFYSTWDGGYEENISIFGTAYTADELAGLTDLAASESSDWIYRVVVEVRKEDAELHDEALVQLKGAKEK